MKVLFPRSRPARRKQRIDNSVRPFERRSTMTTSYDRSRVSVSKAPTGIASMSDKHSDVDIGVLYTGNSFESRIHQA